MLSFTLDTDKQMDEAETQEFCHILGIDSKVQIKDFLENDDEPHNFVEFFFEVLVEQNIPIALDIDWRWGPDDLFWQVQRYYSDARIELIDAKEIFDEKDNSITSWRVKYRLNDDEKEIEVDSGRPSDLLDALKPDTRSKMIEINFLEDRFSWLIVPDTFNEKRFIEITGAELSQETVPLDVDLIAPLPNKVFFYPALVGLQRDDKIYGVYCIDPRTSGIIDWAGRILPGQTFQQGIATELKSVFDYSGSFELGTVSYKDEVPDKQGALIKRYDVWIKLTDALDMSAKPSGNQIALYDFDASEFVE